MNFCESVLVNLHDLEFESTSIYLCVILSWIFIFISISLQTPSLFSSISFSISFHVFVYLAILHSIIINISFCPYVYPFVSISISISSYFYFLMWLWLSQFLQLLFIICLCVLHWFQLTLCFHLFLSLQPFYLHLMFIVLQCLSFPLVFPFPFLSIFCFFSCPCCCGLLLTNSMAQCSLFIRNCSRNSVCKLVFIIGLYPL